MSDDINGIPKRLRKIRRDLEMSQDNIAAIMGKEFHGYISQLERGLKEPRLSTLQSWANALGHEIHITLRPKEPLK